MVSGRIIGVFSCIVNVVFAKLDSQASRKSSLPFILGFAHVNHRSVYVYHRGKVFAKHYDKFCPLQAP